MTMGLAWQQGPLAAEDVAGAVVFALTGTFMTGVSIGIDGGESLV
jgi:hypothetical protein